MQTLVGTWVLMLGVFCGQNEATLLPILAAIKGTLLNANRGDTQGIRSFMNDGFHGQTETRLFQASFSDDSDSGVGAQILRQEAPLIHEIEMRISEGLEAERNLTSLREEIRRELAEAESSGGLGDGQRAQMENRIWQLDKRLGQLRQKNLEVERRFLDVIGGIRSGTIRNRWQAHNMLGGIAQFYTNVVMSYVNTSVSLAMGIVNFWTGLFGKITGMVGGSSMRLFKMPRVEAGRSFVAGP
ncbi:hypothetical protein HPB49_007520 [Dermacentor silvarum]|uniref:Uncharacterized protein n=1 Tax=Dermacentor silvarum TaxID=543639 RepID=A0ACB8DNA8_DERSI|nr:uncharacterized protein LOC119431620 [Dermacentor silvarum]KAH7973940.1 hypothetical protein HPB49_007520 [Dermacentor silvarum]